MSIRKVFLVIMVDFSKVTNYSSNLVKPKEGLLNANHSTRQVKQDEIEYSHTNIVMDKKVYEKFQLIAKSKKMTIKDLLTEVVSSFVDSHYRDALENFIDK